MWPAYLPYYDVTKQYIYSFSLIREAFDYISYSSAIEFDFPLKNYRRISEKFLINLIKIGGLCGGKCGMMLFRVR